MFIEREVSFTMGAGISVPKSDQVPLLKNAKLSSSDGTAVIADCVSCPQTLTTFTGSSPSSSQISLLSTPFSVPVGTMGVSIPVGMPRRSKIS